MEGDMPGAQSLPPPWSWRRGGWVPGEGWGPLGQVTGEQWSGRGLALNRGHPALFWKSCIDVFHSLSLSSGSNSLFYSTLKSLYSLFSFCFCLLLFSFVFNFLFVSLGLIWRKFFSLATQYITSVCRQLRVPPVVWFLSCVQLCVTPWTAAHQDSLSFTISLSLLKLKSIESVIPSNHLILQAIANFCFNDYSFFLFQLQALFVFYTQVWQKPLVRIFFRGLFTI